MNASPEAALMLPASDSGGATAPIEGAVADDPASQQGRISSPSSGCRRGSRPQNPIFAATERR
jgi:hypothetical protein